MSVATGTPLSHIKIESDLGFFVATNPGSKNQSKPSPLPQNKMEIDASDASAAPPTAPQRAKKGGRATNTYNWQTGETIMAVFAALSASEAVSSSEIPQRWQKAGVFYRQ